MAVVEETRATPAAAPAIADPAPLGLAAFALTTFMLSGHNANFIPDLMTVLVIELLEVIYIELLEVIYIDYQEGNPNLPRLREGHRVRQVSQIDLLAKGLLSQAVLLTIARTRVKAGPLDGGRP